MSQFSTVFDTIPRRTTNENVEEDVASETEGSTIASLDTEGTPGAFFMFADPHLEAAYLEAAFAANGLFHGLCVWILIAGTMGLIGSLIEPPQSDAVLVYAANVCTTSVAVMMLLSEHYHTRRAKVNAAAAAIWREIFRAVLVCVKMVTLVVVEMSIRRGCDAGFVYESMNRDRKSFVCSRTIFPFQLGVLACLALAHTPRCAWFLLFSVVAVVAQCIIYAAFGWEAYDGVRVGWTFVGSAVIGLVKLQQELFMRSLFLTSLRLEKCMDDMAAHLDEERAVAMALVPPSLPKSLFLSRNKTVATKCGTFVILAVEQFAVETTKMLPQQFAGVVSTLSQSIVNSIQKFGLEQVRLHGDEYSATANMLWENRHHLRDCVLFVLSVFELVAGSEKKSLLSKIQLHAAMASGRMKGQLTGISFVRYDVYGPPVFDAASLLDHASTSTVAMLEDDWQQLSLTIRDLENAAELQDKIESARPAIVNLSSYTVDQAVRFIGDSNKNTNTRGVDRKSPENLVALLGVSSDDQAIAVVPASQSGGGGRRHPVERHRSTSLYRSALPRVSQRNIQRILRADDDENDDSGSDSADSDTMDRNGRRLPEARRGRRGTHNADAKVNLMLRILYPKHRKGAASETERLQRKLETVRACSVWEQFRSDYVEALFQLALLRFTTSRSRTIAVGYNCMYSFIFMALVLTRDDTNERSFPSDPKKTPLRYVSLAFITFCDLVIFALPMRRTWQRNLFTAAELLLPISACLGMAAGPFIAKMDFLTVFIPFLSVFSSLPAKYHPLHMIAVCVSLILFQTLVVPLHGGQFIAIEFLIILAACFLEPLMAEHTWRLLRAEYQRKVLLQFTGDSIEETRAFIDRVVKATIPPPALRLVARSQMQSVHMPHTVAVHVAVPPLSQAANVGQLSLIDQQIAASCNVMHVVSLRGDHTTIAGPLTDYLEKREREDACVRAAQEAIDLIGAIIAMFPHIAAFDEKDQSGSFTRETSLRKRSNSQARHNSNSQSDNGSNPLLVPTTPSVSVSGGNTSSTFGSSFADADSEAMTVVGAEGTANAVVTFAGSYPMFFLLGAVVNQCKGIARAAAPNSVLITDQLLRLQRPGHLTERNLAVPKSESWRIRGVGQQRVFTIRRHGGMQDSANDSGFSAAAEVQSGQEIDNLLTAKH